MKLGEEEQKEKQLENYKMMSALTGKSISELMGNEIQNNYSDNDCKSKELILRTLYEPMTGKQLYERIKSQGYNAKYKTLTSVLVRYQKTGFIKKLNNEKPIIYGLTDFGIQNAKNPKMLRQQCIKRYHEFQYQRLKEIIEGEPETFKQLYESIFGSQNSIINTVVPAGTAGSQYSPNDIGSEELQNQLETQIYTPDFFKNADESKITALVDGILDDSLSVDQKKELINDIINQIKNNKTLVFKQQEYVSNKPIGLRNYYSILANSINKPITRSVYENIPFRFIKVGSDIRLKSIPEAGTYRNNNDGVILDFDYVNRNLFNGNMIIRVERRNDELIFYYVRMNGKVIMKQYQITTMSFADYEKAKKKGEGIKLKINT
jgi:hypothetical protein